MTHLVARASACSGGFSRRAHIAVVLFSAVIAALFLTACTRTETHASNKRMIVLGVDGMDPEFLRAHWKDLPNLSQLRKEGDFRDLATTVPPQSPVAWSSFITGMDPGGHGIYDFIHRNPSTRMPFSSMAEVEPPTHTLPIGPYEIPISGGGVKSLRTGRAFWQLLSDAGVPASVIRMPANFPPAECHGHTLAGMGTPDMMGSFGTFSFYTNDPAEQRSKVAGGQIFQVRLEEGHAVLRIPGPENSLRRDHAPTYADLSIDVDPTLPAARFEIGGQQAVLREGEWSGWMRAGFDLIPHLKSTDGIFRIYLQATHPHLRVYISPVNIDPAEPALPISTPASWSRELAQAVGPFYTQGIPEESSAFRAGVLNRQEFLTQSHKVLDDSLRLFHYELSQWDGGLLFYYFSSVDQNSHMLWGRYDDDLLKIYKGIDQAVGEAMRKVGNGGTLMVISDHGFARFDRAVHLNTWLMREGFLTLDDPTKTGDEELFAHVDWSRTQAYSLGLNGIYLNLAGREPGGVVSPGERQAILDKIASRLTAFRDPQTGEKVVETVYFPEQIYRGRNFQYAPDLLVGFERRYRSSWQTALGAVPARTVEDNDNAWIGDHCMAADLVPGVFLSNRKSRVAEPQLYDITATILNEYGVRLADGMIGRSVF